MIANIKIAKDSGLKFIYLDECNFTKLAVQNRDWSAKYTNLCMDEGDYYTPYRSVIAAVSANQGLELAQIYDQAITQKEFSRYLAKLSRMNNKKPFVLFMDNL